MIKDLLGAASVGGAILSGLYGLAEGNPLWKTFILLLIMVTCLLVFAATTPDEDRSRRFK